MYFLFKTKKKKKKQKKLKKIEKTKETKEEKRKNMLLTVYVENLMEYDAIVCEFALCNSRDQPTKRERVLKNDKLWKAFVNLFNLCSR